MYMRDGANRMRDGVATLQKDVNMVSAFEMKDGGVQSRPFLRPS